MRPTILLLLTLLSLPATSRADGQKPRPCEADVHKLCAQIQPGNGRVLACLQAHSGELSAACKTRLPQLQPKTH